jgi:HEAT repeat protein
MVMFTEIRVPAPVFVLALLGGILLLGAAAFFLFRSIGRRRAFQKAIQAGDIFSVWVSAQKKPSWQKLLTAWARERGEETAIRLLAASCGGEDFEAQGIFFDPESRGDLLRELTGNPEWHIRYFAYRMLLGNKDPKTPRTLEDGLSDPHARIRQILAAHVHFADQDRAYAVLWDKLIHDPVYEVRRSARERIQKYFPDRYHPLQEASCHNGLGPAETARLLELADPHCQEDRNLALTCLESENPELVFPAAVFLDSCGILNRLLSENSLDDPAAIHRNVELLHKALSVKVSGFINRINRYIPAEGPPEEVRRKRGTTLLTAARLLHKGGGTRENTAHLAEEVFSFFFGEVPEKIYQEIYTLTLETIDARGDEKSFTALARELSRRENDPAWLELLLPRIPARGADVFLPLLFRFLHNPDFPARQQLIESICRFEADLLLPEIFRVLNSRENEYPHRIKVSVLHILARLKLPWCLDRILEDLPGLSPEEQKNFAALLARFPRDSLNEKAGALLRSGDSQIRAAVLTILPELDNRDFMKEIRDGLRDPDPDLRIAAIRALLTFGEIKLINQETSMLRDPIERVRLAAAACLGQCGNPGAMGMLKTIMADPHETGGVKRNIIAGLGLSHSPESLRFLADLMEGTGEFPEDLAAALRRRTGKRDILQLVEIFKDGTPDLREKLIPLFRTLGEKAEPEILELLKDEVASLKPWLARILEETGYVEKTIRRLSHRDVRVRREAALLLSLLDTLPGFRGLVMAARDPDQEVRVLVVKALEKLNSPQGRELLEQLKEDPDKRIRKYTHWALERLDSLGME